jgi:hypothetical protein
MADYDEAILQRYVNMLYSHAVMVVVGYVLLGAVLGAALGYAPVIRWYWLAPPNTPPPRDVGQTYFLALLGGALFFLIGQAKAFKYRLEAQRTLCQMQIERNTRKMFQRLVESSPPPPPTGEVEEQVQRP